MKTSKKKSLKAVGVLLVLLLAGIIFFFMYYQVDEVQVMGSSPLLRKTDQEDGTQGTAGIQFCFCTASLY